jgi:hypothetical protein
LLTFLYRIPEKEGKKWENRVDKRNTIRGKSGTRKEKKKALSMETVKWYRKRASIIMS